jgi:DNA-binding response OmpR family regulator
MKTILVVEDNEAIRMIIEEFLFVLVDMESVTVITTDSVAHAEVVLQEHTVALLITDLNLGAGPDGLSLIDILNKKKSRPFIAAMSSIPSVRFTDTYLKNGKIDQYLEKPFTMKDLRILLDRIGCIPLAKSGKKPSMAINYQVLTKLDASSVSEAPR